jgi:hypothetical protein
LARLGFVGGIFARLMPREEYFEKALYTFDIGQNDLGAGFFSMSVEEVNASVPDMINAFSTNVEVCNSIPLLFPPLDIECENNFSVNIYT